MQTGGARTPQLKTHSVTLCVLLHHLLSELSWLAEGRSGARLESVAELCAGRVEGKWDEGAEAPLVLMFIDGDSGFGVEEADEAEKGSNITL